MGGAYAVPGVGSVGKGRGGGEGGGWGEVDGDFASSTKVRSLLSAALSLSLARARSLSLALSLLTPFPPPTPYFFVCVFLHQLEGVRLHPPRSLFFLMQHGEEEKERQAPEDGGACIANVLLMCC